jgi:hypothetical protein
MPGRSRSDLRPPSKAISWKVRKIFPRESFQILKNLLVKATASEEGPNLTDGEYLVLDQVHQNLTGMFPSQVYYIYAKQELISLLDVVEVLLGWKSSSKTRWSMIQDQVRYFQRKGFLPKEHAYFGWLGSWKVERLLVKVNRLLWRKPPEERRLGVGHRDTGTARDVSYDASPHWTEVGGKMTETDIRSPAELLEEQLLIMHCLGGSINLARL